MLCPSCSAAALDAYGRCPHCGYSAAPPAQPYPAYYPQRALVTPTAPAGIGLAAQILMAVAGLLAVVGLGVNVWDFGAARNAVDTGTFTDPTTFAAVAAVFNGLGSLICLATGVVFIVWFFKSANLARILAPGQQSLPPGWAIGGWFIPLAYWVLPRIVAGDIWRSAIPLGANPTGRKPRTYLVTWWWLTFIVGQQLLSFTVNPITVDSNTTTGLLTLAYGFSVVVDLCRIASAVLGIIMIRKVTSMQQVRILQGPGLGHPYAAPVAPAAPYAAYADPTAYGYPGATPAPDYAPAAGTPYAPSYPQPTMPAPAQPAAQPQDAAPTPYRASVPPQADAATADAPQTEAPQAETEAGKADSAQDVEPRDTVPVDVPTAVIPRRPDQAAQEPSTMVLAPVPAQRDHAAPEAQAEPQAESAEPQDAVPATEPKDA